LYRVRNRLGITTIVTVFGVIILVIERVILFTSVIITYIAVTATIIRKHNVTHKPKRIVGVYGVVKTDIAALAAQLTTITSIRVVLVIHTATVISTAHCTKVSVSNTTQWALGATIAVKRTQCTGREGPKRAPFRTQLVPFEGLFGASLGVSGQLFGTIPRGDLLFRGSGDISVNLVELLVIADFPVFPLRQPVSRGLCEL